MKLDFGESFLPTDSTIELLEIEGEEVGFLPKWKIRIAKWLNIPIEKRYNYTITFFTDLKFNLQYNDVVLIGQLPFYLSGRINDHERAKCEAKSLYPITEKLNRNIGELIKIIGSLHKE